MYWGVKTDAEYTVKFVASKTRVSSTHGQTIPRLELLLLARLMTVHTEPGVVTYFDRTDLFYRFYNRSFLDSWCQQELVENRVAEIRKLLPEFTAENIALATPLKRSCTTRALREQTLAQWTKVHVAE